MKEMEASLNRDMEELRKQKDRNIVQLNDTIEANRKKYEANINALKINIEQLTAKNLGANSEILALNEALKKLCDINQQHEEALLREQDNQAARSKL